MVSMYDWVVRGAHTMPPPDLPLPYFEFHPPAGYPIPKEDIPTLPVRHVEGGAYRDPKMAEEWRPYPYVRDPEPNFTRITFQCHAALHIIIYELADVQRGNINGEKNLSLADKKRFYKLLDDWRESVPEEIQGWKNLSPGPTFMK